MTSAKFEAVQVEHLAQEWQSSLYLLSNLRVVRCREDVTMASAKEMYFEAVQVEHLVEDLLRAVLQMLGLALGDSHCSSEGSSAYIGVDSK
jgi:hypothetical protein